MQQEMTTTLPTCVITNGAVLKSPGTDILCSTTPSYAMYTSDGSTSAPPASDDAGPLYFWPTSDIPGCPFKTGDACMAYTAGADAATNSLTYVREHHSYVESLSTPFSCCYAATLFALVLLVAIRATQAKVKAEAHSMLDHAKAVLKEAREVLDEARQADTPDDVPDLDDERAPEGAASIQGIQGKDAEA